MSKTLRKRKIAKAYGLKFYYIKQNKLPDIGVVKRYSHLGLLTGIEMYYNNGTAFRNEVEFYKCIERLRPKTFKSRIGGNY